MFPSLDLSPDGNTLYVSNEDTAELTAVDLSSGTIRGRARVDNEPGGVTAVPDGKVVLVTSERDNAVTAVDTQTLAVIAGKEWIGSPKRSRETGWT